MSSGTVLLTGPLLVGCVLAWSLFGVLSLQLYIFHSFFPTERLRILALVYTLYTLSAAHTVMATHFTWQLLVFGWGDPSIFAAVPWSGAGHTIITGLVAMIAQMYFSWRIWTLKSQSIIARGVTALIILVSLMQAGAAFSDGIRVLLISKSLGSLDDNLSDGVTVWLVGSFACDIIISITMIIVLHQVRRAAHYKRTDAVVRTLMIRTVETGSVTAIVAGLVLLLFQKYSDNYIYLSAAFLLCNLYSNVVIATLNGRLGIKQAVIYSTQQAIESHQLVFKPPGQTQNSDVVPEGSCSYGTAQNERQSDAGSNHKIAYAI